MRNYHLKAYQKIAVTNIKQQFQAGNHTCCILPTGTGKSYVAMAVADQFAGSHVLYVTSMEQTRSDIQDQFEKYELECNLDYSLYCNLDSNTVTDYSLIVLDEFHRAGAEEWSKYVKRVLDSNPQAKVLGLTATPYRYMDNRDMAEELFGGNIAYRMELSDAIADGILPLPQYVGCFLDILDVIREAENDYRESKKQSAEVENLFEKAKQLAGGAPKLPDIIRSHMTNQTGKYIVFCRNIKHLEEMMTYADEWFSFAPEKHLYVAHSDGQKDGYEQFVKDDAPVLRLLYCVDMLNEGVHPKDIAGVIMLRPTASQNVYFQQLGRALTVEERSTSPLIIDVVNNATILKPIREFFADVKGKVERTGRYSEQDIQMLIDINPAYVDILELLDTIHDELRYKSWEEVYAIAEQYYRENGDLLVPATTVYNDINLGTWVRAKRHAYKKGALSEERIAMLNAIGMVWDSQEAQWNETYSVAEQYYRENGNLLVPRYCVYNGVDLGMWISNQRRFHKKGALSEERIAMLNAIGMAWDPLEAQWNETYSVAEQYYRENGNLLVPRDCVYNGVNLGTWIRTQRNIYKKSKLSEERVALLNAIGMVWDTYEAQWNETYSVAEQYYRENGNLLVPNRSVYNGVNLGTWINVQRDTYKKGALSEERIAMLNAIGMVWGLFAQWNECYQAAERYYHENGNLLVPYNTVYNDVNLGKWLNSQRHAYKKGKLTEEHVALLNAIGMVWVVLDKKNQWNELYQAAEKYYHDNGNLLVPYGCVYNGINLGQWITKQRVAYKKGALSEERIAMLNTIGMVWDPQEAQWNECYRVAEQYYHENGNLLVPQWYDYHGVNLGTWVKDQRRAYRQGKMTEERIALLNAIGMVWDPQEAQWNEVYRVAEQYYRENGDLLVPNRSVYNGCCLGAWLKNQRQSYKQGKLSEKRIAMLTAIGMKW